MSEKLANFKRKLHVVNSSNYFYSKFSGDEYLSSCDHADVKARLMMCSNRASVNEYVLHEYVNQTPKNRILGASWYQISRVSASL